MVAQPSMDLRTYSEDRARYYGVPGPMFRKQIQTESGWDTEAFNAASGATGVAQIIPRWHPGVDATDPYASLDYAAKLMAGYYRQFGSWRNALAAYNWSGWLDVLPRRASRNVVDHSARHAKPCGQGAASSRTVSQRRLYRRGIRVSELRQFVARSVDVPPFRRLVLVVGEVIPEEQVERVAAGAVVTGVQHPKLFSNRAVDKLPCDPMGTLISTVPPDDAVPLRGSLARPDPARPQLGAVGGHGAVLVNPRPEAVYGPRRAPRVVARGRTELGGPGRVARADDQRGGAGPAARGILRVHQATPGVSSRSFAATRGRFAVRIIP